MIKKFFAVILIASVYFSPCVLAEETNLSVSPSDIRLQKVTEEANRNKELLEIWKDHVRTLTKERDDAYQQIEKLKNNTVLPEPPAINRPAHFGEIETQPLPPNAMARNISAPEVIQPSAQMEKDFKGYQETIKDLRHQLDEMRIDDQRMKKEIMESGNDKTMIIRNKEEAISKIELLSKQVKSLQNENENLQNRLRSANVSLTPVASSGVSKPSTNEPTSFLQNAYNLQSAKLKMATQDKERIAQRADEIQKKYVDLQTAYEKLKIERQNTQTTVVASAVSDTVSKNQFETNYLKSQNAKLKSDLDKLRVEMEKNAADKKTAGDDINHIKSDYESKLADRNSQNEILKKNLQEILQSKDALSAKNRDLEKELESLRANNLKLSVDQSQINVVQKENQTLQSRIVDAKASEEALTRSFGKLKLENQDLTLENGKLKNDLEASGKEQEVLAAKASQITDLQSSRDFLKTSLEEVIAQKGSLESQTKTLQSEVDSLKTQNSALEEKTSALAGIESQFQTVNAKAALVDGLQAQKDSLSHEAEELKSQNGSMAMENLRIKNDFEKIKSENTELKTEAAKVAQIEIEKKYIQSIYSDMNYKMKRRQIALDQALKKIESEKAENQKMRARESGFTGQLESLKTEQIGYQRQIENLKSQLSLMQDQEQKVLLLQAEKGKLLSESDTMKKAMVDLEHEAQAHEDKVNSLNAEIAQMRESDASLKTTQEEQLKTIASLKADLKQSLDDVQNLKNNFQSYLESMVSSFEERQKKSPPAAQ